MSYKNDYTYTDDFDLKIQSGDFKQGQANDNHTKVIMYAGKGELRQYVLLGASINSYIGSSVDIDIIENTIKNELQKDNILVVDIDAIKESNTISVDVQVQ